MSAAAWEADLSRGSVHCRTPEVEVGPKPWFTPTANATFHDRRLPANQPTTSICIPETVTQGLRGVALHSLAN